MIRLFNFWLAFMISLVSLTEVYCRDVKNVLFIFADDLGYKDLGCFGSSFYETPNLDALARQGVRMVNAYAACPVCSPTRSSIMTGQYPARTKNTDFFGAYNHKKGNKVPRRYSKLPVIPASYDAALSAELTTLPEELKKHGFKTFFAGKWHLGKQESSWPEFHGFDINKGGHSRGGPYGGDKYFSPYGNPRLKDGPAGEHLPDRLATETLNFIKKTEDRFFAYLSFYSVHTPLMGRQDLVEKYRKKSAALNIKKEKKFANEFPRRVRIVQDHAIYGAMVEAMDQAIGKVLEGLKEAGKYEDTMIIFFSDNGGLSTSEGSPTSNAPLRAGKGWLYEGGIKEPTILKIPGLTEAGTENASLMISTDFYPSILEACGLPPKPQQHIDGKSILGVFKNQKLERNLFWHYPHWGNQGGSPGSVIRKGNWKYIQYYTGKRNELFNLSKDPSERKNLIDSAPKIAREMADELKQWLIDIKANMPYENPQFDPGTNPRW